MKTTLFSLSLFVAAMPAATAARAADVSQATANTWPAKWCTVQPGATKEALVAAMGPPTTSFPTQMSWSAKPYQFNAFLAADGKVKQLDINLYALSDAQKAALPCAAVRTPSSVARAAAAAGATPATAARPQLPACELVSASEMSAILGAPVAASPNGQSKCVYQPSEGASPYVELSVDWGDGEVAMSAVGAMSKHEPGIANPYEGLGDQAAAVGPALMIRTGKDLMTIVFSGVDGAPAKAKKIFDTAKARM